MEGPEARLCPELQHGLSLGVEVEEGVNAQAKLGFDLFAAAFEDVHLDAGFVAVFQLDWGFADCCDFVGREQTHSVDHH